MRSFPGNGTWVPYNANPMSLLVRGDYAANAAYTSYPYQVDGPASLAVGDQMTASNSWPDQSSNCAGIAYFRSQIKLAQVFDGSSNTYLIGEKYLNPDFYLNGADNADNEGMYCGFNNDNHRTSINLAAAARHAGLCPFRSVRQRARRDLQHGAVRRVGVRDQLQHRPYDAHFARQPGRQAADR